MTLGLATLTETRWTRGAGEGNDNSSARPRTMWLAGCRGEVIRQHEIDQCRGVPHDWDVMLLLLVASVAIDQCGPHAGRQRPDHVRARLIADVHRGGRFDVQRLE